MSAQPVRYSELDGLTEAYAISEKENRELKRKVHRLELLMSSVSEDSPEAGEVRELLDLWWAEVMDSDKRVAHGLESTRAAKVRAAIRRRKKVDPEGGFELCRRAVLGVKEDDWAMGRVAKSGGRTFKDIAEHILSTDGDIEKFAKLYDQRGDRLLQEGIERQMVPSGDGKRSYLPRFASAPNEDPLGKVLRALQAKGCDFQEYADKQTVRAQCPVHKSHGLTLKIFYASGPIGENSRLLVNCFAGCETVYVMDALGLTLADLFERHAA